MIFAKSISIYCQSKIIIIIYKNVLTAAALIFTTNDHSIIYTSGEHIHTHENQSDTSHLGSPYIQIYIYTYIRLSASGLVLLVSDRRRTSINF